MAAGPKDPETLAALAAAEEDYRSLAAQRDAVRDELAARMRAEGFTDPLQAADEPWFLELEARENALSRAFMAAVEARWNARQRAALDPRTGKPRRRREAAAQGQAPPGEGYYPDLLLPITEVRGGCEGDEVSRHSRRPIEHTSCRNGTFHLFRYLTDDGTAIAGLTLKATRARAGKQTATIDRVYTDKAHRRQGYAAALLTAARSYFTRVNHSRDLTDAGALWKRAVNPVYQLPGGRVAVPKRLPEAERSAREALPRDPADPINVRTLNDAWKQHVRATFAQKGHLRMAGAYDTILTVTRSTRQNVALQLTLWTSDMVPTGHYDLQTIDEAAPLLWGNLSREDRDRFRAVALPHARR